MKDPAFLFYYQDFLVGTSFMTLEEVGAYIKLLCFQAAKGPLTEEDILKKIPLPIWQRICCNFLCANGKYENKRLSEEITKRRLYCENRRKNLHMDKHMDKHMKGAMTAHMENENENENEDINTFFDYFLLKTKKAFRLTDDCKRLIGGRLKEGYTIDQLKKAVDNFVADPWEGRKDRLDLIYCIGKQAKKPDNLEKWINAKPQTNKRVVPV